MTKRALTQSEKTERLTLRTNGMDMSPLLILRKPTVATLRQRVAAGFHVRRLALATGMPQIRSQREQLNRSSATASSGSAYNCADLTVPLYQRFR